MGPLTKLTKLFKKESLEAANRLSLTLTVDRVLACIWTFDQDQVKFLGYGQKRFANIDSLIHQTALAIDTAGEQAKSDISKTVFGLSHNWFEDGELSIESSKILKNLSQDLELDPQAFVSLPAAINHLLKIEESITPQVILVGIFADFCEVHLLKNNKITATYTVDSQPTIGKIIQLVGQLKSATEDLPSRIVIYGLDEKSPLKDEIAKADWKDLFIHEPKITVLDDEELAKAVAYTQAADILGYEPSLIAVSGASKEIGKKVDEFGFIEGEDILKVVDSDLVPEEKTSKTPEETEVVTGKDYAVDFTNQQSSDKSAVEETQLKQSIDDSTLANYGQKQTVSEELITVGWLPKILGFFKKRSSSKKLAVFLIILLVLILIGAFIASQTLTKAEIVIKVNAKSQESNFDATVVTNSSYDASKSQIAGQEITGEAENSQKAVTTGNKKLGDKAKGEVTVFNWTTSPKTFPSQTTIISKNGLKFTLDSDIEVASRSASTPGQTKVTTQAVDFGPNSNLDTGNDFTFQEFDELLYSARNDSSFTGGAERQVTVVSQDDLNKLEKSLTDTLNEKAKENLKSKTANLKLYDQAIVTKVLKKNFDKKLDEEASLLNLDMKIQADAIVYDETELKNLLSESIKDKVPQNLESRAGNIEVIDINVKRKNNTLSLSGKYQANLTPKFDEENFKSRIAGQSPKSARAIIKEIPEVSDVTVNFSPNLPLVGLIPRNKSKIVFKFETT